MTTSAILRAADLLFDPTSHTSKTPDGRDVPHVTAILKATGVAVDFDAILARGGERAENLEYRRALGTAVHADCHSLDDCDLDWNEIATSPTLPYVRAWATFRENLGLMPLVRERQVLHPAHNYTGILDGIFHQRSTGKQVLIDIKIGDPAAAGAHLQTAAYEAAFLAERKDIAIHQRWAVRLCPDLAVPYRITNYSERRDAWRDFQKFQACLTVFHEQPERRGVA